MAQRRFHYEQAFEHYLRANRVPYVAVDEAKKSLDIKDPAADVSASSGTNGLPSRSIKSFDFVVYAPGRNLLVDVKGRMYGSAAAGGIGRPTSRRRLESWVTDEDVEGLSRWQELFGREFQATFVFAYCLRQQPPDALFEELFCFSSRWYALRETPLDAYCQCMERRSKSWGTLHVPAADFARISRPFSVRPISGPLCARERRLAG